MLEFEKKNIKVLAFDVDGTLFSSEGIILETYVESIQNFITASGKVIPIPEKEKIMAQVGLPVKQIFQNLLPELTELERDSISDNVLKLLCDKILEGKGKLYEGVERTLEELFNSKYLLCAASNGRAPYIQSILKAYNLEKYFQDLIVINYITIKSKGDILKSYTEKFNLSANSILMIGDRKSDLDAALSINCSFAYCEYGHADLNEVNSFSISLKSIKTLLEYL